MTALEPPDPLPTFDGIVLRPFQAGDVAMLRELATDPYVSLTGSLPAGAMEPDALAFIARQHERWQTGVGYSFCIADRARGGAPGTAGLWLAGLAQGRASVGYTVAPSARGRGVATRALRALTAFAWTITGLERIELYVEPWNTGSLRAAEAAGYAREGLLRSHQPIGGRRTARMTW